MRSRKSGSDATSENGNGQSEQRPQPTQRALLWRTSGSLRTRQGRPDFYSRGVVSVSSSTTHAAVDTYLQRKVVTVPQQWARGYALEMVSGESETPRSNTMTRGYLSLRFNEANPSHHLYVNTGGRTGRTRAENLLSHAIQQLCRPA